MKIIEEGYVAKQKVKCALCGAELEITARDLEFVGVNNVYDENDEDKDDIRYQFKCPCCNTNNKLSEDSLAIKVFQQAESLRKDARLH